MVAIKADPGSQQRLLDLQATDSALAQLDHRRRTLPEHAELARLKSEHAAVRSDLVAADTAVSDLELEQTKAESDLEPVRERLARNQRRIADGSVPDAKALSSMVAEVDHLKKRIGDLEDAELEVMEQLEQAVAERDRLRGRADELIGGGGRGHRPAGRAARRAGRRGRPAAYGTSLDRADHRGRRC